MRGDGDVLLIESITESDKDRIKRNFNKLFWLEDGK